MISDNIERVRARIGAACQRCGRNPGEITLVGVTKFADIAAINEAIACGLKCLGENKVQQAAAKFPGIKDADGHVTRHMIGHLQTNKAKQALQLFDLIESVDSLKLAEAIDREAQMLNQTAHILVQVNTAGETKKFGIAPNEAGELVSGIAGLKHIHILGLMAIAPLTEDQDTVRTCFRGLRELRDRLSQQFTGQGNIRFQYLSMGMTDDFEIAIEEGSTMVRIGRAIFQ